MQYVLDADTVSFYVRRNPNVLLRLRDISPDLIALSTITLMEIDYGLARKPERRASIEAVLLPFLNDIHILNYNWEDARATASIRASLAQSGQPIGPYDVMLAGTALARGLILVSGNIREFSRVSGLLLEDWQELM
jgi:tRNA(fMet)-specific endonuclease VapC